MKKVFIGALCLLSSNAFCMSRIYNGNNDHPGFYVGGSVGVSRIREGNGFKNLANNIFDAGTSSMSKDIDQGGFGGNIFVGYQFDPYIAVEGGYTHFADNTYKATNDVPTSMNTHVSLHAWNLVGKVIVPFSTFVDCPFGNVFAYAKLGVAYASSEFDRKAIGQDIKNHGWKPAYGVGVGYAFNKNIAAEISWFRVDGGDKVNDSLTQSTPASSLDDLIPTGDLFALGVTFKLVQ